MSDETPTTSQWWSLLDSLRSKGLVDPDEFACSAALAIEGPSRWSEVKFVDSPGSESGEGTPHRLTFLQRVWTRTMERGPSSGSPGPAPSTPDRSVEQLVHASGLLRRQIVSELTERLPSTSASVPALRKSLSTALSEFDLRPSRAEADLTLYRGPADLCRAVLETLGVSSGTIYLPCITDRRQAAIAAGLASQAVVQGPTHQQVLRGALVLALAGVDCRWSIEDALQHPVLESGRLRAFDATLIVPPIGKRGAYSKPESLLLDPRPEYPVNDRTTSEFLYLIHAVESTDPTNGVVLAVLPDSVLFKGGPLSRIRSFLVRRSPLVLTHVVSMPTPFAGTGVAASIVVLQRAAPDRKMRFIDAQPFVEGRGDRARYDTGAIVRLLQAGESEPGVVAVTPADEVLQDEVSWDVRRYIKPKEVETLMPRDARRAAMEARETRAKAEDTLVRSLEELSGAVS